LGNHDNRLFDSSSPAQSQALRAILVGGFVVGVLDLGYAILVYDLASQKLGILVHRALLFGLIYGALVYLFMHMVVLPLSAVPPGHTPLIYKACEFVWHGVAVGMPIALSVRHYSR